MGIISDKYSKYGTMTVGTVDYDYTDYVKNIISYGTTENVDKSILYSSWNKPVEMFPDLATNNKDPNRLPVKIFKYNNDDVIRIQYDTVSGHSTVSYSKKLVYNPEIPKQSTILSNVFFNSVNQYTFGDVNSESTSYKDVTSTQQGNTNIFRDIPYNNVLFGFPSLNGFLKTDETHTITDISITDFLNNPDDYYLSTMSTKPITYIWNGEQYNTTASLNQQYFCEYTGYKGFKSNYLYSTDTKTVYLARITSNANYDADKLYLSIGKCIFPTNTTGMISCPNYLQIGNYKNGAFGERYSMIDYTNLTLEIPEIETTYLDAKPLSGNKTLLKSETQVLNNSFNVINYYVTYSTTYLSSTDKRYPINNIYAEITSYIDSRYVYNILSGMGCYFISNTSNINSLTPETLEIPEITTTYLEEKPLSGNKTLLKSETKVLNNSFNVINYYVTYSTSYLSSTDKRYPINNIYAEITSYIDGRYVYNILSGMGCYFISNTSNINSLTPETLENYDNVYLGEMDKNGFTTLKFINGEKLKYYNENNKNGNTTNENYNYNNNPALDDLDNETDMDFGSIYSVGGMVNYYKVTSETLKTLSKLMSCVDVVGTKDLLPNLISLKAFPIDFDRLARGTTEPIKIGGIEMTDKFIGTATGTTIDSTYRYLHCFDYTVMGKYGNISEPHFLDFAPYTTVELILPFGATIVLPDNAMYKSLSCDYVFDIVSGNAIAVVKSSGTIIATIPCTLSQDIPFSAINVGAKASAMVSNITGVLHNLSNLGISVGTGNVVSGITSTVSTIGNVANTAIANNHNYIEKFGRTGDMCDIGLCKHAYIKYTRPIDISPDNFGKTHGYLINKKMKLSECRGFTVCDNVDINISATDTEKRMIKQLLETGIYI